MSLGLDEKSSWVDDQWEDCDNHVDSSSEARLRKAILMSLEKDENERKDVEFSSKNFDTSDQGTASSRKNEGEGNNVQELAKFNKTISMSLGLDEKSSWVDDQWEDCDNHVDSSSEARLRKAISMSLEKDEKSCLNDQLEDCNNDVDSSIEARLRKAIFMRLEKDANERSDIEFSSRNLETSDQGTARSRKNEGEDNNVQKIAKLN